MNEKNKQPKKAAGMMGVGIALGIGIGTAFGVAIDNISLGIGIGIAIGVGIGAAMSLIQKNKWYYPTQTSNIASVMKEVVGGAIG